MNELPTWEVVPRGGQLVWRVCGPDGLCVEDCSGVHAQARFDAECRSRGISLLRGGPSQPMRGPCEVDEPGT